MERHSVRKATGGQLRAMHLFVRACLAVLVVCAPPAVSVAVARPSRSATVPAAPIRPDGPLVPERGALFGAFHDRDGRWSGLRAEKRETVALEKRIGRRLKIHHHFYNWYQAMPGRIVRWDVGHGRIPMISWEPSGIDLDHIIEGDYNALIRRKARALKSLRPARVFLRWGHEMNGTWYSWGGPNQNSRPLVYDGPAKWIAAYQHIHRLFALERAGNVVWVWGPNNESLPNEPWNHYMAYYPGDAYVDWVAVSGFNWGDLESWSTWRSFRATFRDFYDDFALRKPIMIAETGSARTPGSRYRWILSMGNDIKEYMPSIAALVYFNASTRWFIRADEPAFRALKQVANRHYFKATP